jgi:hypothetical protein
LSQIRRATVHSPPCSSPIRRRREDATPSWNSHSGLTGFGSDSYGWDVRGRLQTAARPGYSGSFTYDPNNERAAQTVNGVSTSFLLDGSRCVSEISGATTVPVLFGAGGQAINRNGRWFTPDSRGSTSRVTDGTGNVVQTYGYGVFGQVVPSTPEANPIQFLGGMNDNNGLHYLGGSSYFSPQIGQGVGGNLAMVAGLLPGGTGSLSLGGSHCVDYDSIAQSVARGMDIAFTAAGGIGGGFVGGAGGATLGGGLAAATAGGGSVAVPALTAGGAALGTAAGAYGGHLLGQAVGSLVGAGVTGLLRLINHASDACTNMVTSGSGGGPRPKTAGQLISELLPKEIKDKASRAFGNNALLSELTPAERELAASAYEQASELTTGPVAEPARLYNLERAKFLRGQVPRIAGTLRAFMAERGIPFPGD